MAEGYLRPSILLENKAEKRKRSNWACLPYDLLVSIFDKPCFALSDYVRFSSVCKSWKSVTLSQREKRRTLTKHQLPLLMLAFENSDACQLQRGLKNFTNGQISHFNFPILHRYKSSKFHGSSHGWLIYSLNVNFKFRLVLHNSFSGAVIHLPSLEENTSNNNDIEKVILSSDPSFGRFEVLVSFAFTIRGGLVAHLNFGEKFWTYSQSWIIGRFHDSFIFYKDRLLCGTKGRILSLNFFCEECSPSIKIIKEVPPQVSDNDWYSSKSFLIESTSGDLLMVYRYAATQTYNIFKIVDSNGKLDCIPVMNLDGHSLFLDDNQSISVLASKYSGCKANSIYYLSNKSITGKHTSVREIEEFNLEDQILQRLPMDQWLESWILPSMKSSKTLESDWHDLFCF